MASRRNNASRARWMSSVPVSDPHGRATCMGGAWVCVVVWGWGVGERMEVGVWVCGGGGGGGGGGRGRVGGGWGWVGWGWGEGCGAVLCGAGGAARSDCMAAPGCMSGFAYIDADVSVSLSVYAYIYIYDVAYNDLVLYMYGSRAAGRALRESSREDEALESASATGWRAGIRVCAAVTREVAL